MEMEVDVDGGVGVGAGIEVDMYMVHDVVCVVSGFESKLARREFSRRLRARPAPVDMMGSRTSKNTFAAATNE
jgi:hypothetical protein